MRTAYTPCTVIATTVSAYAENGGCAPLSLEHEVLMTARTG